MSDITSFQYDFLGTGTLETWVVGLGKFPTQKVMQLFRVSTNTAYLLDVTSGYNTKKSGYGAAFTYRDSNGVENVYFAGNKKVVGLYQLVASSVDLTHKTVSVRRLGVTSSNTANNDGLHCKNPLKLIPFPTCGDKDGTASASATNPVTDTECGSGYTYDSSNAGEACAASPCGVGSSTADDQSLCCTTPTAAPVTAAPVTAAPTNVGDTWAPSAPPTTPTPTSAASSDATLATLTLSTGAYAPKWSPDATSYVQYVPYATTEITVPCPALFIISS